MRPAHHRHSHAHPDAGARIEAILDQLRGSGGRITTGRRAIVAALITGPDHHVTAEDVASLVQIDHPDVHLSTVYRTLESLESLGIVDRVNLGSSGAVYHLTDHVHHHLVCDGCGSVTEIPHDQLAGLGGDLADRYGFEISARHLSIAGRCATCRAAPPSAAATISPRARR